MYSFRLSNSDADAPMPNTMWHSPVGASSADNLGLLDITNGGDGAETLFNVLAQEETLLGLATTNLTALPSVVHRVL
jgi:hypothetical protein